MHAAGAEGDSILYEIAQKSGTQFVAGSLCPFDGEEWTSILPFEGAVQDGVIVAAKVCLENIWHIRSFHFFKPCEVTIKLGQGDSQITFIDKTESIRSYAEWDPHIRAKAGRVNGFLISQEKVEKLKDVDEPHGLYVLTYYIFG